MGNRLWHTNNKTKPANPLKIKKITLTQQPLEIFSKLQKQYQTTYLLESIEGPKKLAQYSFIGFDPKITIQTKNEKAKIKNEKTGETTTEKTSDPLQTHRKTPQRRSSLKQRVPICRRSSRLHFL